MQVGEKLEVAFARHVCARRFCKSTGGNVAITFALMLIPLLTAIGGAIDLSRAMLAKQRLAGALDATALAVSVEASSKETGLHELAQTFFDANYPETSIGKPGPIEVMSDDDIIRISGTARVDTTLLELIDINYIDVAAVSETTRNWGTPRISR